MAEIAALDTDTWNTLFTMRPERLRELLREHPELVASKYTFNRTLLHYAASMGYYEHVENLIAAGADRHAKDVHGCTPLDVAHRWAVGQKNCLHFWEKVVQLL